MDELAIALAIIAGVVYAWYSSRRTKRVVAEILSKPDPEDLLVETASWLGCTGLGLDAEREVGRYLRREIGQSVSDPDSVKLDDLEYLGVFLDDAYPAHYWRYSKAGEEGYVSLMSAPYGLSWSTAERPTKPHTEQGSYA